MLWRKPSIAPIRSLGKLLYKIKGRELRAGKNLKSFPWRQQDVPKVAPFLLLTPTNLEMSQIFLTLDS